MIKMAEQIKVKKQSSIKRNRFLKHFFTYLYMILLSIIIIYPLLITTMTAFKNSDVVAFTLDFSGPWTLNNFKELFTDTLYGTWYGNTLIISIFTMVVQVAVITLAGIKMAEQIKVKKQSSIKRNRFLKHFFTYLYMILLSIIIIYPLLITTMTAFKNSDVVAFTLDFSGPWTLNNFKELFTDTLYGTWYGNTLIISIFTMVVQVAVITLAGYTYSRYNFAGKKWSLTFFLVVQMVPTMAALTAYYVLGMLLNGLDHDWFLILIYIGGGIPMNTWLMKGYFDTVPYDFDESAKLDGAGNFTIFWKIVMPLVKPMIAVQALWAFMGPFGDYMTARYLLREEQNLTVAVGLQEFISDPKNQQVALFAAGAILIALPICALFFYLQRYFVTGLTAGGAKG